MKRIFQSRMMLIPLGIFVGLIARSIFGGPPAEDTSLKLDPYTKTKSQHKDSSGSDSVDILKDPLVQPLLDIKNRIEIPIWRKFDNVVDNKTKPIQLDENKSASFNPESM